MQPRLPSSSSSTCFRSPSHYSSVTMEPLLRFSLLLSITHCVKVQSSTFVDAIVLLTWSAATLKPDVLCQTQAAILFTVSPLNIMRLTSE